VPCAFDACANALLHRDAYGVQQSALSHDVSDAHDRQQRALSQRAHGASHGDEDARDREDEWVRDDVDGVSF